MLYQSLNQESLQRINDIVTDFKNNPNYTSYSIRSYCYDVHAGVHAIEVGKGSQLLNLFLFYPNPNGDGKIESIAIYGIGLHGHLNEILKSNKIFGMDIKSAELDHSGMSDFVDVFLK